MTKSYWLKKISIPNADLFLEYIRTVLPWIKSVGGVIVKRDLIQESTSNEWDGGQLGLVIEFESKFAAKKAFYSEVFQKYLQSRDLMELVTISTLKKSTNIDLTQTTYKYLLLLNYLCNIYNFTSNSIFCKI